MSRWFECLKTVTKASGETLLLKGRAYEEADTLESKVSPNLWLVGEEAGAAVVIDNAQLCHFREITHSINIGDKLVRTGTGVFPSITHGTAYEVLAVDTRSYNNGVWKRVAQIRTNTDREVWVVYEHVDSNGVRSWTSEVEIDPPMTETEVRQRQRTKDIERLEMLNAEIGKLSMGAFRTGNSKCVARAEDNVFLQHLLNARETLDRAPYPSTGTNEDERPLSIREREYAEHGRILTPAERAQPADPATETSLVAAIERSWDIAPTDFGKVRYETIN